LYQLSASVVATRKPDDWHIFIAGLFEAYGLATTEKKELVRRPPLLAMGETGLLPELFIRRTARPALLQRHKKVLRGGMRVSARFSTEKGAYCFVHALFDTLSSLSGGWCFDS
jgi:hypothetical protein